MRDLKDYNFELHCKSNNLPLLSEWNFEKNENPPAGYSPKSGRRVWWKCKEGHEWITTINKRVSSGTGCPYCVGRKIIVNENDLATLFPDIAKEWNYEKNDKLPSDFRPASNTRVWWKCSKGHEWRAVIYSRTQMGRKCPCCAGQRVVPGVNDFETWCRENNSEIIKEWDYEKNEKTPADYKPKSTAKIWWKCKEGHGWQASLDNRVLRHSGCPVCSRKKRKAQKRNV